MKIKTKIALQYAFVTTLLMAMFASVIYLTSDRDRENEFYVTLRKEGVSKAYLFFQTKATPEILQSIYKSNASHIDEVKVNILDSENNVIYHDMMSDNNSIVYPTNDSKQDIKVKQNKQQILAFPFVFQDKNYKIVASAYDGYGYSKQNKLIYNLLFVTCISILLSFMLGYYLARRALKPVAQISRKMQKITASNLDMRLTEYNKNEFGELARSFNEALNIIEQSFSSQKMFVSNVSHELRTPLAVLAGEIDFALLKQRSNEEYIQTLESSKKDVERLIKLVNGLLTLAQASYNEQSIKISPVRIDEILLDARELCIKNNPRRKVFLNFENTDNEHLDLSILGNEYLLKIAFQNIIENSCKYSNDSTSTIKINSDKKEIIISFTDKGIGISEQDLPNIFQPFFRGHNKNKIEGTGIGLTLVKRVISLHKGEIEVHSRLHIGTQITIAIPIYTERDNIE